MSKKFKLRKKVKADDNVGSIIVDIESDEKIIEEDLEITLKEISDCQVCKKRVFIKRDSQDNIIPENCSNCNHLITNL